MDPFALIAGIATAFAVAGLAALFRLALVRRALSRKTAALEETVETLTDRVFELAESEERHRGLIDSLGDLVVRRDRVGFVTYANQAYADLLGLQPGKLVGTELMHTVAETTPERHDADGSHGADERVVTPTGERWIAWRHHAVRGADGRLDEIQSVGRDITDRKGSEAELALSRARAEAASSAKSRFLATVSHEIRTPLNGIMGMADLLIDTRLTPEQKTYASAVKTSGEALLNLIEEILDFTKIEAGRLDLEEAPFELVPLIEGVAELLGPRAHGKGLDLATAIAPDVPARLVGDATRLRQVILNLAGNAVKFTEAGGAALTVDRSADSLMVAVRDTGPGIAPDDVERIFSEFEQGETTFARRHAGTGLGLAISRRIISHMGGELSVDTVLGKGSTFRIRLPLKAAGSAVATPERLDGLSVAIVSGRGVEKAVLARRLAARGAEVTRFEDPSEIATDARFDTVLVDHRLGETAIGETVAALKARAGRIVLVVTPSARGDVARWRDQGISGWLVSPVREASLVMQMRPTEAGIATSDPLTDAEPARREARVPATGDQRRRILIAEDNEINALLARRLIEKLGHEPIWKADGRAAAAAALDPAERIDLVLMDMQMPECDGLSAAKMIRAGEPEGQRLPIIALTANAFAEDRAAAVAAGMDGFLTKPLDADRLAETLAGYAGFRPQAPVRAVRRKAKGRR
ncbi:response regulator [Phreatobacter aquaticus]|uniref:histidine kinase n=1 Tax=Phreatobacter aquaticus TaxID=2570229 RepID=A0A4D7QI37_9HYPH|nr:ATP-binding protein [Phreatobacter aquaticus]QCK86361.1 response regulator [Phreatobacter aquaticus]